MTFRLVDKNSARDLFWQISAYDSVKVEEIAKKTKLNQIIARIISIRSDDNQQLIPNPKLQDLMPDPSIIKDLDIAVDKIIEIIGDRKEIGILTDYDVDGATSASLLYKYLLQLGYRINHVYIPHRVLEGYGPNNKAVEFFIKKKIDLLIMMDCGATATKQLDQLAKHRIPVVIIDHHKPFVNSLRCLAHVNPHQKECSSDLINLSACGLVFMVVIAINRKLRELGIKNKQTEPNLLDLIELTALSTMADIVPLDNLNRALVLYGLRMINKNPSVVYQAFKTRLNISQANAEDLSYKVAPLINAGARMSSPYLGYIALISGNIDIANKQVDNLVELNNSRRTLQSLTANKIINKINASSDNTKRLHTKAVIIASDKSYHLGIIGLIANEIANKFEVLAIVGGIESSAKADAKPLQSSNGNTRQLSYSGGIVRASLRLHDNLDFNIASTIEKAIIRKIIIKGGGHTRAGGIEYYLQNEEEVYNFFSAAVIKAQSQSVLTKSTNITRLKNLQIDSELDLKDLTNDFYGQLSKLGPFGNNNHQPIFLIKKVALTKIKLINQQHSLAVIERSNFEGIKAISFFSKRNGLHDFFLQNKSLLLDIVIKLSKDDYKYRKYDFQIQILDVMVSE